MIYNVYRNEDASASVEYGKGAAFSRAANRKAGIIGTTESRALPSCAEVIVDSQFADDRRRRPTTNDQRRVL